jgi:DNA-binding NarL/FixJ family response regulator
MRHIRILVADDHRLMRAAIRLALGPEPDLEVVGEAEDGAEVLALVAHVAPDVVLLDLRMPVIDGFQVLDHLRHDHPEVKIVVLSAADGPQVADEARRRGAAAVLEKHVDPTGLTAALRGAAAAGPREAPGVTAPAARTLTRREAEVLDQLASGSSNGEIAQALFLSEQTVKYHLTNLYRKLGVTGRVEAVRYAFAHGLPSADSAPTAGRASGVAAL